MAFDNQAGQDPGPEKPALQTLSKASKLSGYLEMALNS